MSNDISSRDPGKHPVSALGADCFLRKEEVQAVLSKLAGSPERGMLPQRSVAILYGNSRGRLGKPAMYNGALRRALKALNRLTNGEDRQDGIVQPSRDEQ